MGKNNLGCTDQDCGCGCKDCNEDKSVTTSGRNNVIPDAAKASLISNGYAKPSADDYVSTTWAKSGNGENNQMVVAPSGYNKKEIVKTYPARKIVLPITKAEQQKQDNTGVYVAGGLFVLLALLSGKDEKKK